MYFHRKSINVRSPHTHLSLSLTHLSSHLVSLYRCHQPWWCQGGLKPAWVIAKVIDRLTRLYAQLSTENYLSFIQRLKPLAPQELHTLFFCHDETAYMCNCECKCMCVGRGWNVGFWRPLHSSCHWMKKRFCSRPLSLRINSALFMCQTEIRSYCGGSQETHFTPLNTQSLHHIVKTLQHFSWGFKSQCVLFPSNISIVLCCMSDRQQKLL